MMVNEVTMNQMPHLFVIANIEHASPRIPALVFPLAKQGWNVTLLTPQLMSNADIELGLPEGFQDHVNILETPRYADIYELPRKLMRCLKIVNRKKTSGYTEALKSKEIGKSFQNRLIDKLLVYYQAIFAYPDTEKAWYQSAVSLSCEYLRGKPGSIVLSSSPYPVCHLIAKQVCVQLDLKWVADFRDPWSQNHNYKMPIWRKLIDQITEVNSLKTANLIITVSDGVAIKLRQLHHAPVHVVRNGYQPSCRYVDVSENSTKIKISYTGTVYPNHQSLLPILDALVIVRGQNINIGREFELNLFGVDRTYLDKEIKDRGLEEVVSHRRRLPRTEIRQIQQHSDILLFLNWETQGEYGIFPLKFLEYLDSRRPILATGKSSDIEIANILQKTKAGISIATAPEIAEYLQDVRLEFKNSGCIAYRGIDTEISKYSFENSSSDLAKILQQVSPVLDNQKNE
ncbi:hypothetical protein OAH90_03010 [Alphaproteobacteria bacterium]|nr:hypothetical protein [Alphaproteobacteria bacterium]